MNIATVMSSTGFWIPICCHHLGFLKPDVMSKRLIRIWSHMLTCQSQVDSQWVYHGKSSFWTVRMTNSENNRIDILFSMTWEEWVKPIQLNTQSPHKTHSAGYETCIKIAVFVPSQHHLYFSHLEDIFTYNAWKFLQTTNFCCVLLLPDDSSSKK